ncbi:MAG: phosphate/phosphite/phosphonate ABC transporter substrate-binding protein [Burkholderiales bacterium]|nr:MAG: phosphate/phosphite/phosphonate ABC transporter substrate-binding protein [Burkholderiales bacterium]
MNHGRRLALQSIAALLLPTGTRAQLAGAEVRFGVVPYLQVRQLVALYQPVADRAAAVLGRPAQVYTTPDFERFIDTARRGDFDLVGVSAHFARILQREEAFLPLARAAAPLASVILVPRDAPTQSLADLRRRRVAVSDPLALHVLMALRHLRDAGLKPGVDVTLVPSGSQGNAITRMSLGEADAAIGSIITIKQLRPELQAATRVLSAAPIALTPLAYMAHPRLKAQGPALREALLSFPAKPEGRRMVEAARHENIVPLTEPELQGLDGAVTEYYRQRALMR